jgi:hypothetical protein
MADDSTIRSSEWTARSGVILDSYRRLLGRDLIGAEESPARRAEMLWNAAFVVVAHGTQEDPILNYANRAAVTLWETDLATLLRTPSRLTAEPVHRDERARMLQRTREQGFIDDYQGIRITTTGRRFRIHQAIVWNLTDEHGRNQGQAATFSEWEWLA